MRWADRQSRYGAVSIALHWLVAALVIVMLALGFYAGDLPEGPHRDTTLGLHKGLGIVAAAIIVLRVLWRIRSGFVPLLQSVHGWQRTAARLNHVALMVASVLMPISGLAQGVEVDVFGLLRIAALHAHEGLSDAMGAVHWITANVLGLLILIHVVAAMKHHFVDQDETLRRIAGG